jgi:hypothetical protein
MCSDDGSIAAPRPRSSCIHHARSNRIEHNITTQLLQVVFLFHKEALKSALQHVPHTVVTAIEPLCVGAVESFQASTEIGLWRFDHEMIVIAHQAISVASPMLLRDFPTEQADELPPICVIYEDGLLCVAAGGDVVEGASEFETQWASHETRR